MVWLCEIVPERFVGLMLGKQKDNIRRIEDSCHVKITWGQSRGKEICVFTIEGDCRHNCEKAIEMIRETQERCKGAQAIERTVRFPREFIGYINGAHGHTIAQLKTRSGANIWFPDLSGESEDKMTTCLVKGLKKNCDDAVTLIKEKVSLAIDQARRNELGGGIHFACFNSFNEKDKFQLKEGTSSRFGGAKYRIECDVDDHEQIDLFSVETISALKSHLSKSLQILHEIKDEKQLIIDLWCFFCKIVVENIDEDETKNETFTGDYVKTRVGNVFNNDGNEAFWKTTFGESVDPADLNSDVTSENNSSDEILKRDSATLWRYDYVFITPSGRNVRLKVWQDPHAESNEPPDEVKNILQQVHFKGEEGIGVKAWLCYPSTTVIKGDLMIPYSKYDCRIKLRADPRHIINESEVIRDELKILADYLSNCRLDKINHTLDLPDESSHEFPNDFACPFYREAEENKYSAEIDGERYTVIFFEEMGWSLKSWKKTDEKEFGIRVVMNSWSDVLLSPERNWEPEEILSKLDTYMEFVSLLYLRLFH